MRANLSELAPNLSDQVVRLNGLAAGLNARAPTLNRRLPNLAGPGGRLNDHRRVNVLFAHRRSVYFDLPVSVWDERRDAFAWRPGIGGPVIAHPPCTLWSRARGLSCREPAEMECAWFALRAVREVGGVLEHPAQSMLWHAASLPMPGNWDSWGFTLSIDQARFGHRARKPTWLYVVGVRRSLVPEIPPEVDEPLRRVFDLADDERDLTPRRFAWWLEELASRAIVAPLA